MVEVQLLKKLDHPNIVKYQGFVRTSENVSIILEYCENGSLANMCKKYGKIPEYVAALYVEDVLEGLVYLHDQGIIHRDIKGANLLISAEGIIKLADFGVATSTKLDGNCTVVGTPHWMAPEIIEMKGALSATDIWSLGCTVVELLTGHPPYYEKPQMATAFAIVTEDQPPIPDGISESAVDFLHLCFIKEPKLRATAKRLLKHRWITSMKETRESNTSSIKFDDAVKSVKDWNDAIKRPKSDPQSMKMSVTSFTNFKDKLSTTHDSPTPVFAAPMAANNTNTNYNTHNTHTNNTTPTASSAISNLNTNATTTPTINITTTNNTTTNPINTSASVMKSRTNFNLQAINKPTFELTKSTYDQENAHEETWDEDFPDFPDDFSSKLQSYLHKTAQKQKSKNLTSSLSNTVLPTKWQPNPDSILNENSPHHEKNNDDYTFSDLEGDIDVSKLSQRYIQNKSNNNSREVPPDRSSQQHTKHLSNTHVQHKKSSNGSQHQKQHSQSRNEDHAVSNSVSTTKHLRALKAYFEEDDDQDWSKDFGSNNLSQKRLANGNSHDQQQQQQLSNNPTPPRSRQSSEEHHEPTEREQTFTGFTVGPASSSPIASFSSDSFDAEIEEAFDHNSLDSEDQLNLRVLANANSQVQTIAAEMRSLSLSSEKLSHHLNSLVSILGTYPKTQTSLAKSNPLISLVQILRTYQEEPSIVGKALDVLYVLLGTSSLVIQKFCLLGGVPSLLQLADYQNSLPIRYKTAMIIEKLFESGKFSTDIILSSGGIEKLAQFIKEDYEDTDRSELVEVGIKGIYSIFKVQGKSLMSELGYQLSQYQILGPLVFALGHFFRLKQEASILATDEGTAAAVARVNNISYVIDRLLYIFVSFSKMNDYVRENMLESALFIELFRLIKRMEPDQQIQLLKFFQSISTTPQGVAALIKASAFKYLVGFLKRFKAANGPESRQYLIIGEHIFPTVQNMCVMMPMYSKHRISELIEAGAVPYLRDAAHASSPLKDYAVDTLFKIVTVRSRSDVGKTLLREGILQLFLEYIVDSSDWQPSAYDAISTWLENDFAILEPVLIEGHVSKTLVHGLAVASIDTVFDYFLKMVLLSSRLCISVSSRRELWSTIKKRLQTDGPINRLMLLKIIRAIFDNESSRETAYSFCRELGVKQVIEILAEKETTVLAKALSNDILQIYFSANKHTTDESNYFISRTDSVSSAASSFNTGSNGSISGSSIINVSSLMAQNQQMPSILPTSVNFSSKQGQSPSINATTSTSTSSSSSSSQRQRAASLSRQLKPLGGSGLGGAVTATASTPAALVNGTAGNVAITRSQSHRRHRSAATSTKRLGVHT